MALNCLIGKLIVIQQFGSSALLAMTDLTTSLKNDSLSCLMCRSRYFNQTLAIVLKCENLFLLGHLVCGVFIRIKDVISLFCPI